MKLHLTDEELSRVLGMADIGLLSHSQYFGSISGCNCISGAAEFLGDHPTRLGISLVYESRLRAISDAVSPAMTSIGFDYPNGPDAVLAYIEDRIATDATVPK